MHQITRVFAGAGEDRSVSEVPALVARALDGRPTLMLVRGTAGVDVRVLVEELLVPALEAIGATDRLRRVTALTWEQDRPLGVLERLGLLADPDPDHLTATLGDRAAAGPVVLLVAEAQDADPESLFALSSAVHRLADSPVLVVLTATWDGRAPTAPALAQIRRAHAESTVCDHLDDDAVRELAASAGVVLDAASARRVRRHTGGVPSVVLELLRSREPAYWQTAGAWLPATPSARAAMSAALATAGDDVRALVEACAVLRRWVAPDELGRVAEVADPLAGVDAAVALGLLATRPSGLGIAIGFPSRMARAAAYEAIAAARRRELHRRAVDVVADEGDSLRHRALATVATDPRLAEAFDAYAARCAGEGAWQRAGLAWIAGSRMTATRDAAGRRLLQGVDALVGAGDLTSVAGLTPELDAMAETPDRDAVLGYHQVLLGHRAEAQHLLDRAWALCDPVTQPETAARICHRRALHALVDWDSAALVEWAERAMSLASSDVPAVLEARTFHGLGLAGVGRLDEALQAYAEVVGSLPVGAQAQRAAMGSGWLHLALDQVPLAARELELAAPIEYWRGSSRVSLWANAWLARARLALGDLDAAMVAAERGIHLLDSTGQDIVRPLMHWTAAEVAALRGDVATADRHAALAGSVRTDYLGMLVPAVMARAAVALTRADYPAVLRAFEPLLAADPGPGLDEPGFWPWHDTYAIALVATGQVSQADAFLAPHEARAAARGHRSSTARLGAVRGRILAAGGDVDAAREAFDRAAAGLGDLPMPYLRARIAFAAGQTLRRAGKRREAEAALHRAREGYQAIGAVAYADRCARELKAGTRARAVPGGDGGLGGGGAPVEAMGLTPQEQAVVELVADGLTNREVASRLFVSVKTVQYHLTRVYSRLGVRSRAELAALVHGRRETG